MDECKKYSENKNKRNNNQVSDVTGVTVTNFEGN